MADNTVANGEAAKEATPPAPQDSTEAKAPSRPPRKRIQKPNYAKIHAKPLPVEVYPLPAFIPHSPLSLLRIAATIVQQFFSRPSSHPSAPYIGYFSSESRSVHVTDPVHVRALWEMGFFGKGTLSRSEPSWLDREKARLKAGAAGSAEEATRKRREERKLFKLERARAEREQIEQTLKQEKAASIAHAEPEQTASPQDETSDGNSIKSEKSSLSHVFPWQAEDVTKETPTINDILANDDTKRLLAEAQVELSETAPEPQKTTSIAADLSTSAGDEKVVSEAEKTVKVAQEVEEPVVEVNQEHLQLTLEEAFFLSYGLGVLDIREGPSAPSIKTTDLFTVSRKHSYFPTAEIGQLRPDDPFLLNYAVYHYYRSLGWVVRPGVKFSADFMLYNRGPVFSHAEFAVIIIPEYSQNAPADERKESRDWWWLHCVNRVQSQVRKSLVICYVEVPTMAELKAVGEGNIGGILRQYKVREFVLRRFLANRSRD